MAWMDLLVEPLGTVVRKRRLRMGLTLEELSFKTEISRPYLSLIETNQLDNPPSDGKLRRLEKAMGFGEMELLALAQYQRTPEIVRGVLHHLLASMPPDAIGKNGVSKESAALHSLLGVIAARASAAEKMRGQMVPIINETGEPYPTNFIDAEFPGRAAKEFIACPRLGDPMAFAAHVHGSSLMPRFAEGDVVVFSPKVAVNPGDYGFVRLRDGRSLFGRIYWNGNGNGNGDGHGNGNGHGTIRVTGQRDRGGEEVRASLVAETARAVFRLHAVQCPDEK